MAKTLSLNRTKLENGRFAYATKLRAFFELGVRAITATAPRKGNSNRTGLADFAAQEGIHVSQLHVAIKFAELYHKHALRELCILRMPDGKPLSVGHVRELVHVADGNKRRSLEKLTAKHGWSVRELARQRSQVAPAKPSQHIRGRRQRMPRSLNEALAQAHERLCALRRWIAAIERAKMERSELAWLSSAPRFAKWMAKTDEDLSTLQRELQRTSAKGLQLGTKHKKSSGS